MMLDLLSVVAGAGVVKSAYRKQRPVCEESSGK